MYKIFITVRNRLAITKKCLEALRLHSKIPHQIYIYDNQTNHNLAGHFNYYYKLLNKGIVAQVTFNTATSTFNAFSKASACNAFGAQHQQDPGKNDIMFLVFLDNDIIVTPGFDKAIRAAWKEVKRYKLHNVKVIGQRPGGIKHGQKLTQKIAGSDSILGKLGGSGLWSVKNNFFDDVGFLPLRELKNRQKGHDQTYWRLLAQSTGGQRYILGLGKKLGIHCGRLTGSICNALTRNRHKDITFENQNKKIDSMKFPEFYEMIRKRKELHNDW